MQNFLLLLLVSTVKSQTFTEIAEAEQEANRIKNLPPPEAETIKRRLERLVQSIDFENSPECSDVFLDTAQSALARTFAIFCAKMEKRALGM
jgi:hypothetical protein